MSARARSSDRWAFPAVVWGMLVWPVLLGGGCGDGGGIDMSRPSEFGFQTSVQTSLVDEGKAAYKRYCVGCHGADGDGNGEAARFMSPRPRNFRSGSFKFSSTRAGRLPTDEDLRRTITRGLKASAMPAWDLLPARTVDALIAYIKTFSPKWRARQPAPAIPLVDDPYRRLTDKQAAIERGEAVYHGYATCWTCHPAYVDPDALNAHLRRFGGTPRERFRERLHESLGKPNTEGEVIFPPDFTRDFVRSGVTVEDLYRSIGAGITGTAMPTWIDSMSFTDDAGTLLAQPSDVWAVAYYVRDLIGRRPAKLSEGAFAVRDRRQTIYPPGAAPPAAALPPSATEEGFIQMDEEFVEDEDD